MFVLGGVWEAPGLPVPTFAGRGVEGALGALRSASEDFKVSAIYAKAWGFSF